MSDCWSVFRCHSTLNKLMFFCFLSTCPLPLLFNVCLFSLYLCFHVSPFCLHLWHYMCLCALLLIFPKKLLFCGFFSTYSSTYLCLFVFVCDFLCLLLSVYISPCFNLCLVVCLLLRVSIFCFSNVAWSCMLSTTDGEQGKVRKENKLTHRFPKDSKLQRTIFYYFKGF